MKYSTIVMFGALTIAFGVSANPVKAGMLTVSSYSMPNGDGSAHGGSLNYWDGGYSHCVAANCTTDGLSGAYLSGGTGALTDGVIATLPWYNVSNSLGTGPYVGWYVNSLSSPVSPTITFQFASSQTVGEVKLFVDNSHVGGVTAPDAVIIDGVSHANPTWASASPPMTIDIGGLSLTGSSITVQLQESTYWVFLSEAEFFSGTAVPEPATLAILATGVVGVALRRRRAG